MVTTAVGQKCPRCARQSGRAKGNPEPVLLARAFGAGVAVAAAGAVVFVFLPFAGILLALAHGFVVGAAVRWGPGAGPTPGWGSSRWWRCWSALGSWSCCSAATRSPPGG